MIFSPLGLTLLDLMSTQLVNYFLLSFYIPFYFIFFWKVNTKDFSLGVFFFKTLNLAYYHKMKFHKL